MMSRAETGDPLPLAAVDLAPGGRLVSPHTAVEYTLGEPLGHGEFGAVYACSAASGQHAAKCFFDRDDVGAELGWAREYEFARRLRHPHVIAVMDGFEASGHHWMIMERAEGNLDSLLHQHGSLGPTEVHDLGVQLLAALATVHDAGAIHRDIQIYNVLHVRAGSGRVAKLCDFGISKWLDDTGAGAGDGRAYTAIWGERELAPEYHTHGYVSTRSDLYQVGYVLFHALTGYPALCEDDGEPATAVTSGLARQRALDLGTPLGTWIADLLHPDPAHRLASAAQAIAAAPAPETATSDAAAPAAVTNR